MLGRPGCGEGGRAKTLLATARNLTGESSVCKRQQPPRHLDARIARVIHISVGDDIQPLVQLDRVNLVTAVDQSSHFRHRHRRS